MKELCQQFGPERRLIGILTEPSGCTPRLGLVLVSAGLLPKFGPYRLYAELARRLAHEAIATLRFDLGGIGDSAQEYEQRPLKERTALEIKAAIDHLCERHEFDGIALAGLCSGAEDAFRAAEADPRVTDVVMIDPFAYRTAGWAARNLLHRARRRALRALGVYQPLPIAGDDQPRLVNYKYMDRPEAMHALETLLARETGVHFVYTAGAREMFNHERQLRAQFSPISLGDRVTLDYFPQIDHTQLLEADRRALIEAIAKRLQDSLKQSAPRNRRAQFSTRTEIGSF
ncbi:MAG TPA: hypothetical protein VHV51_20340 [Polyangiaceae bacterium]|jgi:pimeloyl-ACP methyl ester carboxylesterase|nr:hypothetical protein [Polyangiaceae bacterium]